MPELNQSRRALRAHDVHHGLREVDRDRGLVGSELRATQAVGMAAALATAIKGQDVVAEARAMRDVAANQLDINPWAFDQIVGLLERVDMVRGVERDSRGITSFYESVPRSFEEVYDRLGSLWSDESPGELEEGLLASIEQLSYGPRPLEDLVVAPDARSKIVTLGEAAESIRIVTVRGDQIACSPFFAFEHPEQMAQVMEELTVEPVREAYEQVRRYQGLPLSMHRVGDTLRRLVGAGLMAGPAVQRPDGTMEQFAVAPYGHSQELLTIRKALLDKALAIVAAVRTGQHFGGITRLADPQALLHKLQSGVVTAPHSSTKRQYRVLYQMGIVRFVKADRLFGMQLIDDDDNREAITVAMELLAMGEAGLTKEAGAAAAGALLTPGSYRTPIQTVARARDSHPLSAGRLENLIEIAMGRGLPYE